MSTSAIIPGCGQLIYGHPYKAALFLGAEAIFGSLAYNQDKNITFYRDIMDATADSLARFNSRIAAMRDSADVVGGAGDSVFLANVRAVEEKADNASFTHVLQESDYINSRQLRNMQLFWAGGMYVYNLMDAFQIARRLNSPAYGEKSPGTAVWCSLLMPGLGQVYNGSYSKAGMIWMAQAACVASALYRQGLVDFFQVQFDSLQGVLNAVRSDSAQSYKLAGIESQQAAISDQRDGYRRRRNSFIWYSIGIYLYNVFDALVDAHLHNFDDKPEISLRADPFEETFCLTWSFALRRQDNR